MSYKAFTQLGLLFLSISPQPRYDFSTLMSVEGRIYTSDIHTPILIHFSNFNHFFNDLTYEFQIFENDILKKSQNILGSQIKNNQFTFEYDTFDYYRDFKNIKIKISNPFQTIQSPLLTIFSCEKQSYVNYTNQSVVYNISTPVATTFTLRKNEKDCSLDYLYEKVSTTGMGNIIQDYSRYISFHRISLFISTLKQYELEEISTATLRLYTQFPNTDLKNIEDSAVDVEFSLIEKNKWFYLNNEYRFYQDQVDGAIYENKNSSCGNALHPFFIPFNCINRSIDYAIIFSNIGYNKNTFYIRGNIKISRPLYGDFPSKYYYHEEKTPLIDVEYEQ